MTNTRWNAPTPLHVVIQYKNAISVYHVQTTVPKCPHKRHPKQGLYTQAHEHSLKYCSLMHTLPMLSSHNIVQKRSFMTTTCTKEHTWCQRLQWSIPPRLLGTMNGLQS